MSSWDAALRRWTEAGLIDPGAAERIRSWERGRGTDPGARWPARLALGLGGLMVGAGILLFVAAHWDGLSPGQRFVLVLAWDLANAHSSNWDSICQAARSWDAWTLEDAAYRMPPEWTPQDLLPDDD